MKPLLIILTLLCVACVGCTLKSPLIVTAVSIDSSPNSPRKYMVILNDGDGYLKTDSLYAVGDTIK